MKIKTTLLVIILIATCILTAACSQVEFEIKFFVDGEEYGNVVTNGDTIKMPKNPQKEGYIFDGWFWDEGQWQKPFSLNSILDAPLSEYLSVFAKWKQSGVLETNQDETKNDEVLDQPVVNVEPSEEYSIDEMFFEMKSDKFVSDAGRGDLYHWYWDELNLQDQLGQFLIEKGYTLVQSSTSSEAMSWHGTRIEAYTERYFSVEYFDGKGNNFTNDYFDPNINLSTLLGFSEMFFGISPSSFNSAYYDGSCNWTWHRQDMQEQLSQIFEQKGYIRTGYQTFTTTAQLGFYTSVTANTNKVLMLCFVDESGNGIEYTYSKQKNDSVDVNLNNYDEMFFGMKPTRYLVDTNHISWSWDEENVTERLLDILQAKNYVLTETVKIEGANTWKGTDVSFKNSTNFMIYYSDGNGNATRYIMSPSEESSNPDIPNYMTAAQIIGEAIKDGTMIARGSAGDFIVKVKATDQLIAISRLTKNSMFVSIGPFSYIEKGYVLINVVPQYNEFRILDVDVTTYSGQYYSVALSIPSGYVIPDFSGNVNGGTDDRTAMMFFGIEPTGYEYNSFSGGTLYHWTWQNQNMLQQLCSILESKGYILMDTIEMNNAMTWQGTRVEMNTVNMGYYHVEYFDGNGNMIAYRYSK